MVDDTWVAYIYMYRPDMGLTESKEMVKYIYKGPLYRNGELEDPNYEDGSTAVSPRKAMNNILHKARKKWGLGIDLDPDHLYIDGEQTKPVEVKKSGRSERQPTVFDHSRNHETCKRCGYRLDTSGTCPVCDQGDEGALERN